MKPRFENLRTTGNKPLKIINSNYNRSDWYSAIRKYEKYDKKWNETPKKVRKFLTRKGLKRRGNTYLGIIKAWNQYQFINTPLLNMKSNTTLHINEEDGKMTFSIPYKL